MLTLQARAQARHCPQCPTGWRHLGPHSTGPVCCLGSPSLRPAGSGVLLHLHPPLLASEGWLVQGSLAPGRLQQRIGLGLGGGPSQLLALHSTRSQALPNLKASPSQGRRGPGSSSGHPGLGGRAAAAAAAAGGTQE